jgi:hypothetical protein
MTTPTSEQINCAKDNLHKIIIFNKDLLNQANMKLESAYALLNDQNKSDLGLQTTINFLGSCFKTIGSLLGPEGVFVSNFLSGLVSSYVTDTPFSLSQSYATLIKRLQDVFIQIDQDLSKHYEDPVKYWDVILTGSFNTYFDKVNVTGKLGDLSKCSFPAETDSNYYVVLKASIIELDKSIWSALLKSFVITQYVETKSPSWNEPCDTDAIDNGFLKTHKSYYHEWTSTDNTDKHGNHYKIYKRYEYNIGTGVGPLTDGALNDGACHYLFKNLATEVENDNGLFSREEVFTKLDIPTKDEYVSDDTFKFATLFRKTYDKPLLFIHGIKLKI